MNESISEVNVNINNLKCFLLEFHTLKVSQLLQTNMSPKKMLLLRYIDHCYDISIIATTYRSLLSSTCQYMYMFFICMKHFSPKYLTFSWFFFNNFKIKFTFESKVLVVKRCTAFTSSTINFSPHYANFIFVNSRWTPRNKNILAWIYLIIVLHTCTNYIQFFL